MAWDLEWLLEAEEDRLKRWLANYNYEVLAVESLFKGELAKYRINYTGAALFIYKLYRQGRNYPNGPA